MFYLYKWIRICLRKNNNDNKKCHKHIYEIIKCGSLYKHLKIEKEYLIKIVNYN